MQRDTKLGLALGVLLIGSVGAFFFRNDTTLLDNFPRLKNPAQLDERIVEKPFFPYLTGVETETEQRVSHRTNEGAPSESAPLWEIPFFLKPGGRNDFDPMTQTPVAPNPIPVHSYVQPRQPEPLVPRHNRAWVPDSVPRQPRPQYEKPQTSKQVTLHRVQAGETLSALAARYLGSSSRYLQLFEANRDLLKSPNDLIVGTEIRIPTTAEVLETARKPKTAQRTTAEPVSKTTTAKNNDNFETVPAEASKPKRILWQQPPTILNNAD